MDEPWKHAKWKKAIHKRPHTKMSRIDKPIEVGHKVVAAWGWERVAKKWGGTANGMGSFGGDKNVLKLITMMAVLYWIH